MDKEAIDRLQLKSANEAIIHSLEQDFNLAPMVARTLFERLREQYESHYQQTNDTGQLTYLALLADTPASRSISNSERVPVKLSLHQLDDLTALRHGVAALRQARIERLTVEAYDQQALLTHEDVACLLSSSLATIKRDVKALRERGRNIPTRGQVKDIGKGVSHKSQIIQDYLDGYTFSEIEQRQRHSISAIRRYCQDFVRVIRLQASGLTALQIQQISRLSQRLISEYLGLYQRCPPDNDRLQLLLATPDRATEKKTREGTS